MTLTVPLFVAGLVDRDGLAADDERVGRALPVQPFASVAVTMIGKRAGLRRRAGEHACAGEREPGGQRAGGREGHRADGVASA